MGVRDGILTISHAAASDEVEVKIQRKMAVLMEDRFIEEEVQRR